VDSNVIRAGIIDDHEAIRIGLAQAAIRESPKHKPLVSVRGVAATVDAFLGAGADICDVVALDLSLADGSKPGDNVRRLVAAGYKVLIYTLGDDIRSLQLALASGAMGVSRKSEPMAETLSKLRRVAAGESIDNQELAAAIETDAGFAANLSEREAECLGLYATGFSQYQVARRMNVASGTVKKYIDRIREKYEEVGRPAGTKIELYRRAVEDGVLPPLLPGRKK
jgi:DNA-binding NarL/FixJ family response regulator